MRRLRLRFLHRRPPDPEGGPTDVQDRLWAIQPGILPHGTIVAGIAGAYAQNAEGIAGVCWDCRLLVLRVATFHRNTRQDCTNSCRATAGPVAASIHSAAGWNPEQSEDVDSGWNPVRARVICTATDGIAKYNNANVFCDDNNVLNRAIDKAHARGCIIIAITGNDVGVCWEALADPDDPTCTPLPVLSVVAPIEDMIATFVYDQTQSPPGALYGFLNENVAGTSWASPQVPGMVALMLGVNPALTFEALKYILEVTATNIGVPGYDQSTGAGLMNAREAVGEVTKYTLPADWNGDGNIETLDAALYLIDYTNAHAMTDLNLDAVQTTDDVTIFLNSYAGE